METENTQNNTKNTAIGCLTMIAICFLVTMCWSMTGLDIDDAEEIKEHLSSNKFRHNEGEIVMYVNFTKDGACSASAYTKSGQSLSSQNYYYTIGQITKEDEEREIVMDPSDGSEWRIKEDGRIYFKREGEYFFFSKE